MRLRLPASPVEESAVARAFAWGAAAVAAVAIMLYGQSYVLPALAVAVAAAGHRDSHRRRHLPRGVLRQTAVAVLMAACVAYLVLDSTQALFGGQLPQAHFALLLLAVTSFDLKTRRNLYSSLWISLALVYLAGVFAWDFAFGVFSVAWLACLAGFWLASYLGARRVKDLRLPTRPAIGLAVLALLAGLAAFTLAPQPQIRPLSPLAISLPSAIQLRGTIESPALPLVAVNGSPGGSNLLDLHFRGTLGDGVVMYVRSGSPAYWTGQVLDTYDRGAWTALQTDLQPFPGYVGAGRLPPPKGASLGTFVQTYRIAAPLPATIYAASPVQSVYFPNVEIGRDAYGGWHAPAPLQPGQTYSVVSYQIDLSPSALRQDGAPDSDVPLVDLDAGQLSARGRALAQAIVRKIPEGDRYDRVAAINGYLQRHYTYTQRLPPVPPGQDPVDWFLFGARAGYCEQFASAEVLMLRSLGIPARLATGYSTGDFNPVLDESIVRQRDAHAWVQAFFAGHEWVPFDPSPGFAAVPASQVVDRWAVSGLGFLAPRLQVVGAGLVAGPFLLLLLVPLAVVALLAARGRVPALRRREPRSELIRLYERAQRRLPRRRGPAETPLEYWRAVGGDTALAELTAAVNEEVYAGRAATPARLAALRRAPGFLEKSADLRGPTH